jgi:hypothetical protein
MADMNTTSETPANDPGYIYGPDDYFAFVESIDPLARSKRADQKNDPVEFILSERRAHKLAAPNKAIWLDCVQSQYFMRLPWKDDLCEIGNPNQSAVRREQLKQLDRSYFRVAFLLTDPKGAAEQGTYDELTRATWHRVVLTSQRGLPVIVAPDFDLDPETRQMRQLRYMGQCSLLERKSLVNALSLDFLPNAKVGDLERGDPNTPPQKPSPKKGTGGVEKPFEEVNQSVIRIRIEEPLVERVMEMV